MDKKIRAQWPQSGGADRNLLSFLGGATVCAEVPTVNRYRPPTSGQQPAANIQWPGASGQGQHPMASVASSTCSNASIGVGGKWHGFALEKVCNIRIIDGNGSHDGAQEKVGHNQQGSSSPTSAAALTLFRHFCLPWHMEHLLGLVLFY